MGLACSRPVGIALTASTAGHRCRLAGCPRPLATCGSRSHGARSRYSSVDGHGDLRRTFAVAAAVTLGARAGTSSASREPRASWAPRRQHEEQLRILQQQRGLMVEQEDLLQSAQTLLEPSRWTAPASAPVLEAYLAPERAQADSVPLSDARSVRHCSPDVVWQQVRVSAIGGSPWDCWEGQVESPKPGGQPGDQPRRAFVVQDLLGRDKAMMAELIAKGDSASFEPWHEAGHLRPSFDYMVIDKGNGDGITHRALRIELEQLVGSRLLPYVRQRYDAPNLEIVSAVLRRAASGAELNHPVPQDIAAFATAVVSLSGREDFEGGLFLQDSPHKLSRRFMELEAGDAIVYRYDLDHGIEVADGCWYTLVFSFRNTDEPRTAPWLRREAERGDVDAQALLGASLLDGTLGYMCDMRAAYEFLSLAGARGHAAAQYYLGCMYRDGRGVPLSSEQMAMWWQRAAAQGHARSQLRLGELLLEQGGGPLRVEEAMSWLRASAEQDDCDAMHQLFGILSEGLYGQSMDAEEAKALLLRAAARGHANAQHSLGMAHLSGTLVSRSPQEALTWMKAAAHGGVLDAERLLASFARGAPEMRDQALFWLAQASKQGDVDAQHDFGMLALELCAEEEGAAECDVAVVGRAWLEVAAASRGVATTSHVWRSGHEGCGQAAECFAALLDQGFKWTPDHDSSGFLQRVLGDFTQQIVTASGPWRERRVVPSYHLCMDLMSVHQSNDPLFRWGNNRGTVDFPRAVTHDDSGLLPINTAAVVDCAGWEAKSPAERRACADEAYTKLLSQGYVVMERLLPEEFVRPLEADFERLCQEPSEEATVTEALRAGRSQTALPFRAPWNEDQLCCHELVLELVARYLCNDEARTCESKEDQAWAFLGWVASGPRPDYYDGALPARKANPSFGAIDVIHTPPGMMPQLRHRDTNLPGVCASLTVNVPLTPLSPHNGPIGFVPGSHMLRNTGVEVLACPPPGSVILYDSFTEHRGCENTTAKPRSVLSMTFDPGVWMRSFDPAAAGLAAWGHHEAYRRKIGARLRALQASARGEAGASWPAPAAARIGRCEEGARCRGRGHGPGERPLRRVDETSRWCCEACADHYEYVERPRREGHGGKVGLKPYLGLAGW